MKVGDLVRHSGLNDVVWIGIITNQKHVSKVNSSWPYRETILTKYCVEWTSGDRGWFYPQHLEVMCK